jgi:hypothetical protein
MPTDLEEQHLHNMLEELLANPGQPSYLIFMKSIREVESGQQVLLMERLKHLGLAKSPNADELYIQLTPQGIDVARHEGGYLGHKQKQATHLLQEQQQQADRDALERAANAATVSSADSAVSAARAAWVAAIFGLAGVIISLVALLQPDKTEPLQKQITALQQQVATLQATIATPVQPPRAAPAKEPVAPTRASKPKQPQPSKPHIH